MLNTSSTSLAEHLAFTCTLEGKLAALGPLATQADYQLSEKEQVSLASVDWGSGELRGLLPQSLRQRLRAFSESGSPLGLLRVATVPLQRASDVDAFLLQLAYALGRPYTHEAQRGGRAVHDLRPIPAHVGRQLGTSAGALSWHTEDAHTIEPADILGLFCLQGDDQAKTLVSQVDPGGITLASQGALARPAFLIRADTSYDGRVADSLPCAVLARTLTGPSLRFDPAFTSCLESDGPAALAELLAHVEQRAVVTTLRAGDLLLIDNRRAAHARTAFHPRYDAHDRWVKRVGILVQPEARTA